MMHDYVLYVYESCPYCRKVFRYMEQAGITLPVKDARDPAVAAELVAIGGKQQVPCLAIDGKAMYESDDIIRYLEENYPS